MAANALASGDHWVTINGNHVLVGDGGQIKTGPMRGQRLSTQKKRPSRRRLTIQQAGAMLADRGYTLGAGEYDHVARQTFYQVTGPDGQNRRVSAAEIKQFLSEPNRGKPGKVHESLADSAIERLRQSGEAKLERILQDSDEEARKILRDTLNQHGSLEAVPESVWQKIRDHYADNDALAAAILLLWVSADQAMTSDIEKLGIGVRNRLPMSGYALSAARQTQSLAGTVDTLRDRLRRKIQDAQLEGPGGVGELTAGGIEQALDSVFTDARRRQLATDQTTGAISGGQIGARDRHVGDDGSALTTGGVRMTVALIWETEGDELVCPRCAPLNGQPEEVWSSVFPDGPGDDAHSNCRCRLRVMLVPFHESFTYRRRIIQGWWEAKVWNVRGEE